MAGFGKYEIRICLVFLLVMSVWLAGGFGLHRTVADRNNTLQLQEMSQQLMRRAEKAVDFVVTASTELLLAGHANCSDASRNMLRQLVLDTGTAVDVYLMTTNETCSSFVEQSTELPSKDERAAWAESRNSAYRIGKMKGRNSSLFGVSWGFDTDLELVLAINADAILFDVLPNELRSKGRIDLSIREQVIASFAGHDAQLSDNTGWLSFPTIGSRYPIRADIRIDPVAMSQWHKGVSTPIALAWSVLGLLVAGTAAYASVRGRNQALEGVVHALKKREIVPHFQPIVDLQSGTVIGCEALARWVKPGGELVFPWCFIPLVERHGLDDQLLSVMIEQAARSLRQEIENRPAFFLSFNVTPAQISRPDFAVHLIKLARQHNLPPAQICVEVTERQVFDSQDEAVGNTAELRKNGFRVAIDDAGTGHNGLAAIQILNASAIKIDKFFVDHIDQDSRSWEMVKIFVSVARRFGMSTVAEGVESEQQARVLKLAGVDAVQGFYYSRPVPASDFIFALTKEWPNSIGPVEPSFAEEIDSKGKAAVVAKLDPLDGQPKLTRRPLENSDEVARLQALYRYQILDSEEEESFDRIPRIIRSALNAPMAAIALIDEDRRWFKSVAGGKRGELPRQHSFCNQTIQRSEPTIVPDTHSDLQFQDNLLVVNAPHIRAYLGVPLETPDGYRIGSVCCVDMKPRGFSEDEVQVMKDLSKMVMEQLELRKLALFDPLTSVRSRRGFRAEAEILLARSLHQHQPFSVLMLDIDHFKKINDGHGHRAGDEVLIDVCQRISSVTGDHNVIGRMGGEEFAIALPNTGHVAAVTMAEAIRSTVAQTPFQTSRGTIHVKVSLGAVSTDQQVCDLDTLLDQSDWALYRAKEDGRNRVRSYIRKVA